MFTDFFCAWYDKYYEMRTDEMYTNDGSDDSRKLKADFFLLPFLLERRGRWWNERNSWVTYQIFRNISRDTVWQARDTNHCCNKIRNAFQIHILVTCLTIQFFFSSFHNSASVCSFSVLWLYHSYAPKVDSFRRKAHISAYIIC